MVAGAIEPLRRLPSATILGSDQPTVATARVGFVVYLMAINSLAIGIDNTRTNRVVAVRITQLVPTISGSDAARR